MFGANSVNVEVFSECMHPWLNGLRVYNDVEAYNKNEVRQ